MSLDETQALRLVMETIRLHVRPTAVTLARSMSSAVRHAHSKYLKSEKQKTAVEAARKKEATQTAEDIEIAIKQQKI